MRLSSLVSSPLLALAFVSATSVFSQESMPRLASVEPASGKIGAEIVVTGENVGKQQVAELFFTDGTNDIKVAMSDQAATTIKCKVPAGAKSGVRYKLMILTTGKEPKLIEQPVRFEIEE